MFYFPYFDILSYQDYPLQFDIPSLVFWEDDDMACFDKTWWKRCMFGDGWWYTQTVVMMRRRTIDIMGRW